MNEILQYRPAFFEGFENEVVPFKTVEQLLSIPWVSNFAASPNFYQFSLSNNNLMAEYRGGREWWVVGIVKNPQIPLPKWNHGIYEVWIDGKPEEIPGTEVAFSCGDDVGLVGGRMVKRRT